MAEVTTLPAVYEKPDLPVTLTREVGQVLRVLIESPHLAMVSAVAICELLQWIKIADAVPAHTEFQHPPPGWVGVPPTIYVPAQPRRMLLSQELSTTLETVIITTSVIKSISGEATGIGGILTAIAGLFRK